LVPHQNAENLAQLMKPSIIAKIVKAFVSNLQCNHCFKRNIYRRDCWLNRENWI